MWLADHDVSAKSTSGRVVALQQFFLYDLLEIFRGPDKTAQRVVGRPSIRNPFTAPPTRRQ
jgi:hypothetical protein